MSDWYRIGAVITFCIVFLISWICCAVYYGFLLGVGLGWLPSLMVAAVAAALWPLLALLIIVIICYVAK